MKKLETRTIFTILSLVGLGATAFLAAKEGEKVKDIKDNYSSQSKDLEKKEVIKNYIPAIAVGAGTAFCIVKSHNISSAEIAAITATATYLAKNRDFIEREVKDRIGEDKLEEIKSKFISTEINNADTKRFSNKYVAEETGKGKTLFYERYSGRMFRSNYQDVDKAIIDFKRLYEGYDGKERVPVNYNDFYKLLGIRETQFGEEWGWAVDDFNYIFDSEITFKVTKISKDADIAGFEDINEDFYIIELYPISYPRPDYTEF